MVRQLEIAPVDDGRRLDRYLERLDGGLPASLVHRLLRQRRVRVNGRRIRDGAHRLGAGDRLEIHHDFAPVDLGTDSRTWTGPEPVVLHRDEHWLVVNKPDGVACSDDGRDPRALGVWLRGFLATEIGAGTARPEPCHRLDRGTTGAVAVALDPRTFDRFRRGLEQGRVRKVYEVVVEGVPRETRFRCDLALDRREGAGRAEPRMVPGSSFAATTQFSLLHQNGHQSLLRAEPLTGRTHQIRAHCRALGLPVVGDVRYGSPAPGIEHQLLHARELALDGEGGFAVRAPWLARELAVLRELGLAT